MSKVRHRWDENSWTERSKRNYTECTKIGKDDKYKREMGNKA